MKALFLLSALCCLAVCSAFNPDWAPCTSNPYRYTPTQIVLNDPPWIGHDISVNVNGTLSGADVTSGDGEITVSFMGVTIFTKSTSLSDWGTPPFHAGTVTLQYNIAIPSIAPKGAYVVNVDFHDGSSAEIACVNVNLNLS